MSFVCNMFFPQKNILIKILKTSVLILILKNPGTLNIQIYVMPPTSLKCPFSVFVHGKLHTYAS